MSECELTLLKLLLRNNTPDLNLVTDQAAPTENTDTPTKQNSTMKKIVVPLLASPLPNLPDFPVFC